MDRVCSILISVVVLHLLTGTAAYVTTAQWGSAYSRGGTIISGPLGGVFIHHTAGDTCDSLSSCSSVLQGIQTFHVVTRGWDDIGYSFLVGQDGQVYEGRGWNRQGAHTYGYNAVAYGIAIMGNFVTATPNNASLNAVTRFLNEAVSAGHLISDYKILGHKDARNTTVCPGSQLYNIIQGWPAYDTSFTTTTTSTTSTTPTTSGCQTIPIFSYIWVKVTIFLFLFSYV